MAFHIGFSSFKSEIVAGKLPDRVGEFLYQQFFNYLDNCKASYTLSRVGIFFRWACIVYPFLGAFDASSF